MANPSSSSTSLPWSEASLVVPNGWTWGALLVAFLTVVGLAFAPPPTASESVSLPIRVYAENGADEHVETVPLDVADASSVDSLYVEAHQPFYHRGGNELGQHEGFDVEGAASVKINDGAWVDVRNETVDCPKSEENHGQCIGGVFSTVRFTLPASNVQSGVNQISFRFNGTDGVRSGYRVLGVGLMRPVDPPVQTFSPQAHGAHDASLLQYEDPSSWDAPDGYDSPSDVSAGESLFRSADLLESLDGDPIEASCSNCHARDGHDLKYFNYSNRAITARSRFHGLSEEEGKQIAAYIRSIQLEKQDGSPYEAPGTPWDPPYQPGPTLQATGEHPDASDQVYWAAGAGLDQVLNKDKNMLPHLFPDGNGGVDRYTTPNGNQALRWKHVHMDSTLNMRELPVSIQFPDWNSWLPDIHPMDAFPSAWDDSEARTIYQNDLQAALENYSGDGDLNDLNTIEKEIQNLHGGFSESLRGVSNETNLPENQFVLARLSNQQWLALKVWESFHRHHLEDVADDMYADDPATPFSEPRSWMGGQRTLFDVGPHIAHPYNIGGGPPHQYGSVRMDRLFSHVWYHLQLIVNPGSGSRNVQHPVDWKYQNMFLKAAPNAGLRTISSQVKASQLFSNGHGVDGSGGDGFVRNGFMKGWHPFTINPDRFMQLRGHRRYSNLSERLREDLYTATLRAWNDFTMRFPIDEFPRETGGVRYNPSDYVPSAEGGAIHPDDHALKIYRGLYWTGDQFPEAYGAMDTLATWGSKMWPTTDGPAWEDLVEYLPPGEGAPPSMTLTSPSENALVPGPDVTITADVSDADDNVDVVEFYLGDTLIGSDSSPPYELEWTDLPFHTYTLRTRVLDTENLIDRDTVTFSVGPSSSPGLRDHGVYYAYAESDKIREKAPNFKTLLPQRGGIAPAFTLSAVEHRDKDFVVRFFGYLDVPEDGTYTFYTSSSDGSLLWMDGDLVVDNDGRHSVRERSGDIALTAGRHFIEVGYFMRGGQTDLEVSWSGPSFSKRTIPYEHLYQKGPETQLSLKQGWNFVSSAVVPDDPDLESTFGTDASKVSIVEDGNGHSYIPSYGISEIDRWADHEGYKVYATEAFSLSLDGQVLDVDHPIPLHQGWNLVPYLPSTKMAPSESFQSISEALVTVKDEEGNTYDPSTSSNEIGDLVPGKGYLVYVENPTELTYPSPQ